MYYTSDDSHFFCPGLSRKVRGGTFKGPAPPPTLSLPFDPQGLVFSQNHTFVSVKSLVYIVNHGRTYLLVALG